MLKTLQKIVNIDRIHLKWINTLSFMENAGARKISACEHPTQVNLLQLKHAAEEHRHSYYLKKQLSKIPLKGCDTYTDSELLAPKATRYYLNTLDIQCSRYLKKSFNLSGSDLRYAAYLFVTYAIEIRADLLYPVYQEVLTNANHKVMVKSIIIEEEGHLEEMVLQLKEFHQNWQSHANHILQFEERLFKNWMNQIDHDIFNATN